MHETAKRHQNNRTKPKPHKRIHPKSHKRPKHHERNPPNQRNRLNPNNSILRKILRPLRSPNETRHQIRNTRLQHHSCKITGQQQNHNPKPRHRHHPSQTNKNRHPILRNQRTKTGRNQKKRGIRTQIRSRNPKINRTSINRTNQQHQKQTQKHQKNAYQSLRTTRTKKGSRKS